MSVRKAGAFAVAGCCIALGAAGPAAAGTTPPAAARTTVVVVNSVSCASAGYCAAVGDIALDAPSGPGDFHGFVVDETKGTWYAARLIKGMPSIGLVSCTSPGDCTAATAGSSSACWFKGGQPVCGSLGSYVLTEKNGVWGAPRAVPGNALAINSLSCGSPGNCAAGGSYQTPATGPQQAFVVDETRGAWGSPQTVPGTAALNADGPAAVSSVSCPAVGACYAGGYYTDGHRVQRGFIAAQARGVWGKALEIAKGAVGPVSCFSAVRCSALAAIDNDFGTFGAVYYFDVLDTRMVRK